MSPLWTLSIPLASFATVAQVRQGKNGKIRDVSRRYLGNTTVKQRQVNCSSTLPRLWTAVRTPLDVKKKTVPSCLQPGHLSEVNAWTGIWKLSSQFSSGFTMQRAMTVSSWAQDHLEEAQISLHFKPQDPPFVLKVAWCLESVFHLANGYSDVSCRVGVKIMWANSWKWSNNARHIVGTQ